MAYFIYKARNARGELIQGVLESADSGTAEPPACGNRAQGCARPERINRIRLGCN